MGRPDLAVVGLGYVGLPLAHQAVVSGLEVVGFDLSTTTVDGLMSGLSHIDDLSADDVREMCAAGFRASTDPSILDDASAIVICVPTPLDEHGGPDLGAVRSAAVTVQQHTRSGDLVVLESTTYPGTTEEIVRPLLESGGLVAGVDFHLAYSPERIDPGNDRFHVQNTPKVVGGVSAESTRTAVALYERFIDVVVPASGTREAEMAKLLENTYRHVNIALVNEMAVFCHELGIDLWETIRLAQTKPFGFQAFYPGPGVGGHCIPIDPNYLSYTVRTLGYPFRFVELAQEISARMPAYVVSRIVRTLNEDARAVRSSRILLLGVTYKKNIADQRESPARPIARRLLELGAGVQYADPFVAEWQVDDAPIQRRTDLIVAARESDLVVVLQDHDEFDLAAIAEASHRLFDTRGSVPGERVEKL